jgi:hypothetical protein
MTHAQSPTTLAREKQSFPYVQCYFLFAVVIVAVLLPFSLLDSLRWSTRSPPEQESTHTYTRQKPETKNRHFSSVKKAAATTAKQKARHKNRKERDKLT